MTPALFYNSGKSGQKFMRYLSKFTKSKYVQSAMDLKYVKKAMEEVSNTPVVLTVEVHFLSGELSLNIPFPPTDRLWYMINKLWFFINLLLKKLMDMNKIIHENMAHTYVLKKSQCLKKSRFITYSVVF